MGELRKGLSIPNMQLLQMKKGNILKLILLEVENISFGELLLKYPVINKKETGIREIFFEKYKRKHT